MVTLRMGSKTWVVLNSDHVVSEIIAKRGKNTNERPHMPVASDLVSNGKRTVIRQEKEWREGRRVTHQLLSGSNLKVYAGMQELESVDMLRRYLREPSLWFAHSYRYATSVLYRIVMGYPLNKTKAQLDDYQMVTIQFVTSINRSYVDFFPSLSRLPHFLQPWRRFWAKMGSFHRRVFQEWFSGDDEEAMYLATSVMAARGDNTRMTINVFIMAMATRPETRSRAREEVDRVCTDGESLKLPRISDLSAMPYVAAMIKEVLRWRPTVPIIPPHQLTGDLEFDGHFIPAGTCFLINSIGLSSEFDNPHEFRPERWIDNSGADMIPNFWGFGGGRRTSFNGPIDDKRLNHQALN
ncbi:cytochrome P450 CYP2 subfamily [Colletotrichum graminicola M1.001]|uniref:Cytochrome P450 CYP2 subfamily n=1 Tax=Colletotrichum graminicola (strain M1.001 / M2 / FGSC 10212) TaxID=645133 RepID=E3QIC8_COLGM|nr:cytochrome P450 CYP2 subfamily [Colletotrichum graminicola M1.001]EFQ30538.1 cytochrome P450 CYP2 subfamily [Colletotrichum graminicola M1.001]